MPKLYGSNKDGIRDIVLTFDDGPHPSHTPRLLDILAGHGIKVIFFVIGNRIENRTGRSIVERMASEGHLVGNHTYNHPNLRKLHRVEIEEDIRKAQNLICDIVGQCQLFRPPYGAVNSDVGDVLRNIGLDQLLWNVDPEDWKNRSEKWVGIAMEHIKGREDSIVLMHDIHKSTVDHVDGLIRRIKRLHNARFVLY